MCDDGIIKHVDILSSPSKARGKVTCRVVYKKKLTPTADGSARKKSPKKNLLERIEKSLTPDKINHDSSDLSSSLSESSIGKKKHTESRRAKNSGKEDGNGPVCNSPTKAARKESDESLVTTPKKKVCVGKNQDFTSPLKKAILSNLDEYKSTVSSENLKLSRNFIPTPLPNDKENYVASTTTDKSMSSFFDTFEGYFDQRKQLRGSQKSKNTMSMATEVTREEFALISNVFHAKLHRSARDRLYEIQTKLFPQYWFEITQGFSLLFYGVGSKREFLEKYVFEYLVPNLASAADEETGLGVPCVVINGYNPTCNYRDVFKDISKALLSHELSRTETKYWGNHVILQIQKLIQLYKNEPPDIKLIILVHNLDGPSLRKDNFQTMLCYLALIRQVAIVASTDHIYAPILWDNFKAQNYNFVFHDVSNYEPLAVESSFKDVMKINRNNSASGAEGAKFVLQSLTHNTKRMYKLLIETQMSNMNNSRPHQAPTKRGSPTVGVELKQLLHLCSAEFVVSNEISLRSMLTEFVEHKMAVISKNAAGIEHIWIPYSYGEMNKLLTTALQGI